MNQKINLEELVPMPSVPVEAIHQEGKAFFVAAPLVQQFLYEIRQQAFVAGIQASADVARDEKRYAVAFAIGNLKEKV